ncbi:type IV pilin protein [Candidatus Rariloculus sp.]|uniref:type IV pilin protein n=1 Tax=Candidatus Rariloculus sp. TaxID=3101265 RepID=UPI003D0D9119
MVLLQKSRGVPRRRAAGVTLIELIVVVGIVALLATVAVPSYRQYTMRAHRTEAKAALLRLAANQERFYLQNNRYSLDPDVLGFVGGLSEQGVYTLAIDTAAGVTQDWIAAATPTPGGGSNGTDQTADTECTSFTLTSAGVRTATPLPNGVNGRCW